MPRTDFMQKEWGGAECSGRDDGNRVGRLEVWTGFLANGELLGKTSLGCWGKVEASQGL